MAYHRWSPYVPVAKRRAQAARKVKQLTKQGHKIEPVEITGRKIARTFWGEAWCNHLEQFSDFANRLPRGRTYVRNGSVCHLAIGKGKIEAIVSGSELYNILIEIKPLPASKWKRLREQCTGKIGSMLELLQGRFSNQVMEIVTDPDQGLFPKPGEISMSCSCPDWADLCKHLAAVLYGVGARLDQEPELLFLLRGVDHEELIAADLDLPDATKGSGKRRRLASDDLSGLFGVEIDEAPEVPSEPRKRRPTRKKIDEASAVPPEPPKRRTARKKVDEAPEPSSEPGKRHPARNKASENQPSAVASPAGEFIPSSGAVRRLRRRFKMSMTQFARLVGVSVPTVRNWEKADRELNLQQKTLLALRNVAGMAPEQAAEQLRVKQGLRMR